MRYASILSALLDGVTFPMTITWALAFVALFISGWSLRIAIAANVRSQIAEHKTRERYSVGDAPRTARPDCRVELSVNPYHSILTFSDFRTDPTAPLPETARLIVVTNWGSYPITNLDANVRVRYDPTAVGFPEHTEHEHASYVPIGHLSANGGSRIVALVNLTKSDVLVLFSTGGTQYDVPREYKHVPGVNHYSVLLPANPEPLN